MKTGSQFKMKALAIMISILAIEIILQASGRLYNVIQKNYNTPVGITKGNTSTVILCLGESTTAWGLGESYPAQLQLRLNELYGEKKYFVVNEGVVGSDTEKIKNSLISNIEKYNPDIIITMMGINDTWQIRNKSSFLEHFKIFKFFKILNVNIIQFYEKKMAQEVLPIKNQEVNTISANEDEPLSEMQNELHHKAFNALRIKDYDEAKNLYLKITKLDNYKNIVNFELAKAYINMGNNQEAEKYFKKYLKNNNNSEALSKVAEVYLYDSGLSNVKTRKIAETYLNKSYEINPNHMVTLRLLGVVNRLDVVNQFNPETSFKAQQYFEKAFKLGDTKGDTIHGLATMYMMNNQNEKAEIIFKQGLDDKTDMGFFIWRELINLYIMTKQYEKAERFVNLALERFPNNRNLEDIRAEIFSVQNKVMPNFEYNISYRIKNFLTYPPTRLNYLKIAEEIESRKIKHVVMQYPNRSVDPLKDILGKRKNIIYVENLNNFSNYLKSHPFEDLFNDKFAEDFGHFTLKGSKMVVEQLIADLKLEGLLP